jgi:hypothetical protein
MIREEFSNQFTELLNSYANQAAFGDSASRQDIVLNEYDKSMFLTQAQDNVVLTLYAGTSSLGGPFEADEKTIRFLAPLITEATLTPIEDDTLTGIGSSTFFKLPDGVVTQTVPNPKPKVMYITYEAINTDGTGCEARDGIEVTPVTQDEFHRIRKNPFRGANSRRALRLDIGNNFVEIVTTYTSVKNYYIRYIMKPKPIILEKLQDNLSIEGENTPNNPVCELPEVLHQYFLEMAVRLALQSRGYTQQQDNNVNR